MTFKYYDMTDNMSAGVLPSPTVPTLNVAAGTQTGHPFDWSKTRPAPFGVWL